MALSASKIKLLSFYICSDNYYSIYDYTFLMRFPHLFHKEKKNLLINVYFIFILIFIFFKLDYDFINFFFLYFVRF